MNTPVKSRRPAMLLALLLSAGLAGPAQAVGAGPGAGEVNRAAGGGEGAGGPRRAARELNRRLGRGNNFMAAKTMQKKGRIEDYILLSANHFNHCRIGYKMDERCGAAPGFDIPESDMAELRKLTGWCLSQGLLAIVNPVHNWSNGPGFSYPGDLVKLGKIWQQIAAEFAGDGLESILFEIANEPHDRAKSAGLAAGVIRSGLAAIRGAPGNETRVVIVAGSGFPTRRALIRAFDNDEIPAGDNHLIGTFHYYDPRSFTKQGSAKHTSGATWGSASDFERVASDFDAVRSANANWARRNNTEPLPIYLGEFGVDNEADNWHADRKKWLSWVRMQAEKRGMAWAHWSMFNNAGSAKGMGPWGRAERNNPALRRFDADPVEALIGRYEFKSGSRRSGEARVGSIYIPKDDTYKVQIHYAAPRPRTLHIAVGGGGRRGHAITRLFPESGGFDRWRTLEIEIPFRAGEDNELRITAPKNIGVRLGWLKVGQ